MSDGWCPCVCAEYNGNVSSLLDWVRNHSLSQSVSQSFVQLS